MPDKKDKHGKGRPTDPRGRLRPMGRAAGLFGWTAGMVSLARAHQALAPGRDPVDVFDGWERKWAAGLLRVMGATVYVEGTAAPSIGARLVVSNHRSALDIPALMSRFGGSLVSRHDVQDLPILGDAATRASTIFVDRESGASGAAAIRAIRAALKADRTVSIFPEGGVFGGDEVRPFQRGALLAARRLEVEMVPVGLAYPPGAEYLQDTFGEHVSDVAKRSRTPIGMAIGTPRVFAGARTEDLARELRDEVQKLVHRARRLL